MAKPATPARDLAMMAIFAGIIAALGLIPAIMTPLSAVPITAQSLGVMLAGAILGGRRGAGSLVLFLVLVALGLPLLAGGRGGLGVFASPTVGFLVGWIVAAFVIGWATERIGAPYSLLAGLAINAVGGIAVLYTFGIVGMMLRTGMSLRAALLAMTPFLIGDALKVVASAVIAKGVHASYPGLLTPRRVVAAEPTLA